MNYDVTIVIPTYNGEFRISKVIEYLAAQINVEQLSWEIVVVDNNSCDKTAAIVRSLQKDWTQKDWTKDIPLRYVFEPKQGLAHARQCGVEHARGNLIGFLDDDNWPAPDWVYQVLRFGNEHPQSGAFNGVIEGAFEEKPHDEIKSLMRFLAVRHHGNCSKRFEVNKLELPPGAGLVVRKKAWLDSVPKKLCNVTRGGNDYEISIHMAKKGWEIWYNPNMKIKHFIPQKRLKEKYLLEITHLYGIKTCSLMIISRPYWKKPLIALRCLLGGIKRLILKSLEFPKERKNLEFRCQLSFDLGTVRGAALYFCNVFVIFKSSA
jgi:glycosyltransferase involved in cell wall biosynthesis